MFKPPPRIDHREPSTAPEMGCQISVFRPRREFWRCPRPICLIASDKLRSGPFSRIRNLAFRLLNKARLQSELAFFASRAAPNGPLGTRSQASPASHPIDHCQTRSANRLDRRQIWFRAAYEPEWAKRKQSPARRILPTCLAIRFARSNLRAETLSNSQRWRIMADRVDCHPGLFR